MEIRLIKHLEKGQVESFPLTEMFNEKFDTIGLYATNSDGTQTFVSELPLQPFEDLCRKGLENHGYYTKNLWSVGDVQQNTPMDDETALTILDDVLTNEYIIGEINNTIADNV